VRALPVRVRQEALVYAVFAAVALAVYAPSLAGGFVSDDWLYLQRNEILALPLGAALRRTFEAPFFANWAPLHLGFLYLERHLFGDAPLGYRITNVLVFAASACALRAVVRRGGASSVGATLAGALLLLHPAAVEAVAWISQSKTLLALLFALLAVERWLAQLETPRRARLAAALGFAALSLLAKSAFVLLPAVFAIAWWTHGGTHRRNVAAVAALGALGFSVALENVMAQGLEGGVAPWFGGSPAATARILPELLWRYVRLAYLPFDPAHCVQPSAIGCWLDPRVLGPLAALIAVALVATVAVRRERRLGLPLAWVVAALLPVIQLIPMTTVFADRYLTLALPGFLAPVAEPLAVWVRRTRPAWAAVGLGLALLAVASGRQAALWAAPERLYAQALAAYPESRFAWTGLGAERHRRGALDEAAAAYLRALALYPNEGHVRHLLARVRLAQGRRGEALYDLEESLRFAPRHPDAAWTRQSAARLRTDGVTPIADGG
jgi:protein O-mannosyl-transferase